MLQNSTVKFLRDLKKNNDKSWFDAHRPAYENAKEDFEQFIQTLIDKTGKKDETVRDLKARQCTFRINRDVRFAKDKSPYKSNFGASIKMGGKKSPFAGYYFHLEPGDAFAGGGIWQPEPADLKKIRQEIDYNFDEFRKIVTAKKFKAVYGEIYKGTDVSLVKIPQGFEKDNPAAEFLRLKSFLGLRKLSDKDLVSKELVAKSAEAFEALQPMLNFINRALHPE
ncbi:MAG: DUF2461 domain-containing protein [Gemmatimonadaceae bacterium]|nr:DUF2461 domain-containing protein [Chitinophagaceae bacterium]